MADVENINEIVEQAFEAESKAAETPDTETAPATDESKPADTEPKAETPAEEKPADEKPADEPKTDDKKPEDEPKAESTDAPKQIRREFVDSHWNQLDADTKAELTRLSNENERNYQRAADASFEKRMLRKTLEPVQGYITEVATQSKIPENDVIRNCVDIIQKLNDNPTQTAAQMIAGGMIRFEDPVAIINTIAKTYGIDTKGDMTPRDIPANYYAANAQARYEARQAKYVKPDENDATDYVQDYINNTPGIKALLDNPDVSEKFLRQINMERNADVNASDITIINRAAEMFAYLNAPQPQPVVQENKPTLAEQKMAKVVSPVASNPVEQVQGKREPLTPEQSVRETLRSMGLDD
jgi:hypothetical protein